MGFEPGPGPQTDISDLLDDLIDVTVKAYSEKSRNEQEGVMRFLKDLTDKLTEMLESNTPEMVAPPTVLDLRKKILDAIQSAYIKENKVCQKINIWSKWQNFAIDLATLYSDLFYQIASPCSLECLEANALSTVPHETAHETTIC